VLAESASGDQQAPAATVHGPEAAPRPRHPAAATPSGRHLASPYVRKQARERGLDLGQLRGSGPGGRIVARDLDGAPAARASSAASRPSVEPTGPAAARVVSRDAPPEKKPLSMMRRTIARRLTESKQTVPHFYLTIDVDAGPLVRLRGALNADLEAAAEPHKVSFNDLVVKAAALAIRRVPAVNAQFTPEALVFHQRVDISMAVAIDDGLVTPVVRDADKKSVIELSLELAALAERARARKLGVEEMSDGTFSISNLGMYGIENFAAVINPPEGAILAVGAIRSEPVVEGDKVVPGKRLKMTLSCDHRVVDGAVGAQYLSALRQILERPMQILAH
jgi:pyruvate dehydrogenase E2 component (dihydrolipoamide acetyltransferase)